MGFIKNETDVEKAAKEIEGALTRGINSLAKNIKEVKKTAQAVGINNLSNYLGTEDATKLQNIYDKSKAFIDDVAPNLSPGNLS